MVLTTKVGTSITANQKAINNRYLFWGFYSCKRRAQSVAIRELHAIFGQHAERFTLLSALHELYMNEYVVVDAFVFWGRRTIPSFPITLK